MSGRTVAVRGATTVPADTAEAIVAATAELLTALMESNAVGPDDIVSLIFTSTPDLTSEFPAAAARALGLAETPLLCATEIAVPGALGSCIRVLMHFSAPSDYSGPRPVYLGEARGLRTDLS